MALFLKRVKQRPGHRSWALGHSTLGSPELSGGRVPGGLQRGKSGLKKKIWPKRRVTPSELNDKRISRGNAAAFEGFGGVTLIF